MAGTMERELVSSPKVFMFPWLAYGHIYPFLEVAKKLADRGFIIHLCSTSVNLDSIKKKITSQYSLSIHLLEITLAESPQLPSSYHTTNGLPPHLMSLLSKSLYKAKPQLSTILDTLKPDLVVYDIVQIWAAALCARHSIPAVKFSTSSAVALSYFVHLGKRPGEEYPFPAIYLSDFHLARVRKNMDSAMKDIRYEYPEDKLPTGTERRHCDKITMIKGSPASDEKYINYLSDIFDGQILPVCPLSRELVGEDLQGGSDDQELIHWLDDKTELSCVFVSFGSEYFLSKEEIEEIAMGLELSSVNFIWALRFPKGTAPTAMEESLPKGFIERVKGRGRVLVQGWAPQARILRHPSIGGFVCHCGWNSIIESIEIGVPIIAVPMNIDQPINARFAVELGVAVEVTEKNGRRERLTIAEVIKEVVVGKTGEELRNNAIQIGEKLKAREEAGFDALARTLTQLCQK